MYSDFYSYEAGNPDLLPMLTDNIEFSYIFKNNLSLTLYGSKLNQGRDYLTITNIMIILLFQHHRIIIIKKL